MKQFKIISADSAMADGYLKDRVFCITGTLNIERKYYEEFIRKHGGTVANHVTDEVDYVLSGMDAYSRNTAKMQEAQAMNANIISEWTFKSQSAGVIYELEQEPKPKKKRAPLLPEIIPSYIGTAKESIQGMVFSITGELSHSRKIFAMFIKKNGGEFKATVCGSVQYLIAGSNAGYAGTEKLCEAGKRGVKIISEKDFLDMAGVSSVY